jgi:hypothetical protein
MFRRCAAMQAGYRSSAYPTPCARVRSRAFRSSSCLEAAWLTVANGHPVQSLYLSIVNRQVEIMTRIASEFGFTPASRSRLQVLQKAVRCCWSSQVWKVWIFQDWNRWRSNACAGRRCLPEAQETCVCLRTNAKKFLRAVYFNCCMPAVLMIFAQRTTSALKKADNSSGVEFTVSKPNVVRRSWTSGVATTAPIS